MSSSVTADRDGQATVDRPFTSKASRDMKMVIGGWLTLLAGVMVIWNGLSGFWALFDDEALNAFLCGVPVTIMGVIAVAGGICALRDVHFSLSLAGAFMAAMGSGLLGFFMGMTALVIFVLSNRDF